MRPTAIPSAMVALWPFATLLSGYVEQARSQAVYEKLEDGSYAGRIPACKGVLAFARSQQDCEEELRSTLEDWILVGLKLKHHFLSSRKRAVNRLSLD
ncbi:MAG: hypothetical protein ACRD5F_10940 [Candidatus Acidiferrales bacterium]